MRLRAARLATIAAVAVLAAACSNVPSGYGKESQEVFMRRCVAGGGADVQDICACAYARIVKEIPWADYKTLDDQMKADTTLVPAQLEKIAAACAADQTTTTTRRPSSTTTTRPATTTTAAPTA